MTFKVPASKADETQNRYEFEVDGKAFDVPKLGYINGELLDTLVHASQYGDMAWDFACYDLFGEVGTESGDAVRALNRDSFKALRDDYLKASGMTLGESSASTDS